MMSDVDHNSIYHRKMALLQEKLRKSEEERLKLEEKFSIMMKECKEEEEERLSHLKLQYENFLEEDRKRRDRNDRIMRSLDRIESRAATLNAKSKRLKLLREHYEAYLKRVYPTWKNKSPVTTSGRNNHTGHSPVSNFDQHMESSYPECFTTPFTTNRRNSVSFSDNLTSSPRLMDVSYSPRNYDDTLSPSGFARYPQHTLDREVSGGKSKFPGNVYQKTVVKNGLEYDRGPDSYMRGMKTEFNNIGTLNDSQNIVNGYSEFAGHSAVPNSDMFFTTDTQRYPSAYENRVQNLSDGKTEIQRPQSRLQSFHENNVIGTMEGSARLADSGRGDLNPLHKRESRDQFAGMSADIEWEQNTSRDLLNMSLTDDGKVSNGPCKTEQLMKHQQNLHMLKMQMEDVKIPVTEGNYDGSHNINKDFLEDNVQKQGKGDLSSDYNKHEESEVVSPHKTYGQESHTEADKLDDIKSVDNSDDISIEIGRKIERALSSERETIRPSESPEKQRNLDIIVEETNNTEENHSQAKSMPGKSHDFSANDTDLLSGAVLTEGEDELQYSLSDEAGFNEPPQQQIILEDTAVHETSLPVKEEQITSDFLSQSGDFAGVDYHTNIEGNGSEAVQGTYESNIEKGDDGVLYLQRPQNIYETAPTYPDDTRQIVYDSYNNETINAQIGEQYLQEASKQEVLADTYNTQAAEFDSGIQQMQTGGGDMNESGIIYDNIQGQTYTYDTVQNTQEDYNPDGQTSENFYVETYESSDPNFGQQLQPSNVGPEQNWGTYNEMAFQDDSGQSTVQPTYQNFEIQQNMNTQNLQPGEFTYSQEIAGNETQCYTDNLEQQDPYNQKLGQDQYFYGNDVQNGGVQIQEDVSGQQFDQTTNDGVLGQQTYQQPEESARGFSQQPNHETNPVMDDGAAISHSKELDENKVSDIYSQQSSEQYTDGLHPVSNESYDRSDNNSELQRQMLEEQNFSNSESVPNTVQDTINSADYFETETNRVKGALYQDPKDTGTELASSETTKFMADCGRNIEESPSAVEVVLEKEDNNVQDDVRHLDTISEDVKAKTYHTNDSNSPKDASSNEQYKDVSRHQEIVESNVTTKSEESVSNSGNNREQIKILSNKELSDLESAKSAISGEEEFTESFDGGKYHEPTVGYERGIPGYNNAADSSTTEDSSERWTTMPKKTRQQMTLKVQNKKAETALPPDEDSSDESGQSQPVLHGSQIRATPHADTSEDSEQLDNRMATEIQNKTPLGEQNEPLHTAETATSQAETKLSRLPARGSSKLPMISTVMDSDNDSLHLGSESSMT